MRRLLPLLLALPLLALDCGETVAPPTPVVASITVTPPLDTIKSIGATSQLSAAAFDQNGAPMTDVTFAWTSGTPGVASVGGATGLATALANGTTMMTASAGGVQGSASLVVHQLATALAITTEPAGGAAGAVLGTQPVVQLRDAGGTTVAHDNSSTVTASVAGATLGGTTTVTVVAGVATFTNLSIAEAGTHTITFASAGLASVGSAGVNVSTDAEVLVSGTAGEEDIGAAAFDGTNFVVAFKTSQGGGHSLRRISTTGALVGGALVIPGASGDPLRVACDGTRCLAVWAHHPQGSGTWTVMGQFVKTDGTLDGAQFEIVPTVSSGVMGANSVSFGGGTYMVEYHTGTSHDAPDLTRYVKTISTSGVIGDGVLVVSGAYEGFGTLSYGGGVFLMGYKTTGNVIAAKTITPAGVVGGEITIATTLDYEPIVVSAFNGTNFLVAYTRKTTNGDGSDMEAHGRFVSPAGATVGGEFAIDAGTSEPEAWAVGAVSGAAGQVVVSLINELTSDGSQTIATRVVTAGTGSPTVGNGTTVAGLAGGKVPLGGVFATGGGKMLLVILRGTPGSDADNRTDGWTAVDLYARVLPVP